MRQSQGSRASPSPACRALGAHAAQGVSPLLPSGSGGFPPPTQACRALESHTVVQGGPPLRLVLARTLWARAVSPLPPPAWSRFPRAAGAGRPLHRSRSYDAGVMCWCDRGSPPCSRCAPWACIAGRGVPLPRRPRGPPPPPPLHGSRGPLRRPCGSQSFHPLPRDLFPTNPGGIRFSPFAPVPHGGPTSPPCCLLWRGLSFRCSHQPVNPPVALLPRFLACPMATISAWHVPTLPLPSKSLSLPPFHSSL